MHIIEYILYSSVEYIKLKSSKHCNYSGRLNWVEGRKRSMGSSNQEVFKESRICKT